MPIPGCSFKTDMFLRREMALLCSYQTNKQENSPNKNMETMKASSHEEARPIDVPGKGERSMRIFIYLKYSENL